MPFPTKETPHGTAVVACPHVDQNCPTVAVDGDGMIIVGSTLNQDVARLTRDEFEELMQSGREMLRQAEQLQSAVV